MRLKAGLQATSFSRLPPMPSTPASPQAPSVLTTFLHWSLRWVAENKNPVLWVYKRNNYSFNSQVTPDSPVARSPAGVALVLKAMEPSLDSGSRSSQGNNPSMGEKFLFTLSLLPVEAGLACQSSGVFCPFLDICFFLSWASVRNSWWMFPNSVVFPVRPWESHGHHLLPPLQVGDI